MDYKPKKNILRLRPDTIDYVYRSINLSKPGEMEYAIRMLRDWTEKQPHFKRNDFSDNFLRSSIIVAKGSIENAKQKIDKLCTLRSLLPENFRCFNAKEDFAHVFEVMKPIVLPQVTEDHCRLMTVKVYGTIESCHISDALKYSIVLGDYMRQCDFIREYICIFDLSDVNIMDVITKLNLMDLRHAFAVYFEGHGLRFKSMYFITTSKLVDTLINLLKQVLKPKLIDRIKVVKSWDEVHNIIDKDILPVDFGGYERSEQELHDDWLEETCNEEFQKYLRDINSTGTDESSRPSYKFNEEYAGMPGTFKQLTVD
ncbi:uncharacterized protein LOC119833804 [Zerene cesonia]|uniref:uncharacterized protein LOC119833804 n=1 Tax=Zerene cesonia TaxID=33412 RepID=UPI0018E52E20|nr:uncharacterized protein LOC119833804 [Zerene cesonia]